MKKVLITGGAGFIGSNLALKYIENGYDVTVLDNLSEQIHTNNPEQNSTLFLSIKDKVKFIKASIEDSERLFEAISDNEIIVHLAAETGTGQSMYEINKYNDVNIGGTAKLIDILVNKTHNVKTVVIASSRSIYGEGKYFSEKYGDVYPTQRKDADMANCFFENTYLEDRNLILRPTDEKSKIHPSSFYAITKQVQEQMIMTLLPNLSINTISLRYQNVYGPGQSLSNPYTGILSIFSKLILANKPLNIFEDGNESRDFIYISDVIEATYLASISKQASNQIFNVGYGKNITVLEIAKLLYKLFEKEENFIISGNYRIGDIRHNIADIKKINDVLGFSPKVDIYEGLEHFSKWVLNQKITNDEKYENSINEMKNKGLLK